MDNKGPISVLSESIIKALLYYDLFDYPLTSGEIFSSLPTNHVSPREVENELDTLVERTIIYKLGNFFSVQCNPALETRRNKGNSLAQEYFRIAAKRADLIFQFPFIRSVMISGSLSKGYADAGSDIDFFVVTKAGRLWIARTLLTLFRRIVLLNSHKYFCVNYFVDESHLEIAERNRFTATELTTLIPLAGLDHHRELMRRNSWILEFYPNFNVKHVELKKKSDRPFKKAFEWLLDHFFPNILDGFLMRIAVRRWKIIHARDLGPQEFALAFKSNRNVSKCHPRAYQNKVITRYEERVRTFIQSIGS